MGIWEIVVGILVLILSIVMVIVIILQEGHQAGLGTVTGGADSFLSRGKAKTADALFARITKYCAITFFVLVVLLNALSYFGLSGEKVDAGNAESSVVEVSYSESSKESSTEASGAAKESSAEKTASETSAEALKETSSEASTKTTSEASSKTSEETSAEVSKEASAE